MTQSEMLALSDPKKLRELADGIEAVVRKPPNMRESSDVAIERALAAHEASYKTTMLGVCVALRACADRIESLEATIASARDAMERT